MDEKTKKSFHDMISHINEVKGKIRGFHTEKAELIREMSAVDARLYNDQLAEDITNSSAKKACTKENWEAMFDDLAELYSLVEQAKLPYAYTFKWKYIPTGYSVEEIGFPFGENFRVGDAICLDLSDANTRSPFFSLYVNGNGLGALIQKGLPYEVFQIGAPVAGFNHDAFTTHLVENWDVIYASAVKYVENLIRIQEAELIDESRNLTTQINNCREALERHFGNKEVRDDR